MIIEQEGRRRVAARLGGARPVRGSAMVQERPGVTTTWTSEIALPLVMTGTPVVFSQVVGPSTISPVTT